MPEAGLPRVFENGRGGRITILDEGSATEPMRFRVVLPPGIVSRPERHPNQQEEFRVISGTFELGKVNGKRVSLRAGETWTLPLNTFHHPRNGGAEPTVLDAVLTPGLDSARMFASLYTTSRGHRGLGYALRVALIFDRHHREIDFPAPVRLALRLMARAARLARVHID